MIAISLLQSDLCKVGVAVGHGNCVVELSLPRLSERLCWSCNRRFIKGYYFMRQLASQFIQTISLDGRLPSVRRYSKLP